MRSGSDYRPTNVCARSYDNRRLPHLLPGHQFGQSLKFGQRLFVVSYNKQPLQLVSNQSVSQYQSFAVTMPDFSAKMQQIQFLLGLRLRPRWGRLQLVGRGWLPLPRNPTPLSALRASNRARYNLLPRHHLAPKPESETPPMIMVRYIAQNRATLILLHFVFDHIHAC